MFRMMTFGLSLGFLMAHSCAVAQPDDVLGGTIGINGASCAYNTLQAALQDASSGDTLYIRPSFRPEYIGKIDIDLTVVQSMPAPDDCQNENPAGDPANLVFSAKSFSHDTTGGLGEIRNGAQVTFRNMTLTNATAVDGGILAVTGGSSLTLDNVRVDTGSVSGNGGLIHVQGTPGSRSTLQLINDSMLMGGQSAANGGGIHAIDADLILMDAQIMQNQATMAGGGIYMERGSLMIEGSLLENNGTTTFTAEMGGGAIAMFEQQSVLISDSQFLSNSVPGNGGAMLISDSFTTPTSLLIEDNTLFQGNAADGNGGAVHAMNIFEPSGLNFDQVTFIDNIAGFEGGGVNMDRGNLSITGASNFINNRARQGGGLRVRSIGLRTTVIDATTFRFNQARGVASNQGEGGAISFDGAGELMINNSIIDQNQADFRGGGIHVTTAFNAGAEVMLTNSAITANVCDDGSGDGNGGGLYLGALDRLIAEQLVIGSNRAQFGGGLYLINADDTVIEQSRFEDNIAERGGGAFILGGSTLIGLDSRFTGNTALSGAGLGGGIRFGSGTHRLNDVLLESNEALRGGAVYQFTGELAIENSRLLNNQALEVGGGIHSVFGDLSIRSRFGTGSERCDPDLLPVDRYCTEIMGNQSDQIGGGIALGTATGTTSLSDMRVLEHIALINNQAALEGSALHAIERFESEVLLRNALIVNNGNAIDSSSVIHLEGEHRTVLDSITVADNSGSALQVSDPLTDLTLTNSIVYNNSIDPDVGFTVPFTRMCNNSQTGSSQSMGGNLGDPGFVTTPCGAYRLNMSSASASQCMSGPLQDLDGLFRIDNLFDQGAFEHDGANMLPDALFEDGFESS